LWKLYSQYFLGSMNQAIGVCGLITGLLGR
jgi:hypothetical protein